MVRAAWVSLMVIGVSGCDPEVPSTTPSPDCTIEVEAGEWSPFSIGETPDWSHAGPVPPRPDGSAFTSRIILPNQVGLEAVYAVEDGGDAPFRIRFAVGSEDTTTAITVAVLINAEMRSFDLQSLSATTGDVPLVDGQAEVDISIPPDSLDPGLNRVDVLNYIHRNGGYRLYIGPTFTIANGTLAAPVLDLMEMEQGTTMSGHATSAYRTFVTHPEWGERYFPRWTGGEDVLEVPTPMVLRIQASTPRSRCEPASENADEVVVLAFRDMEPWTLGPHHRIATRVPQGEQHVARFDLDTAFPDDDEFHHLVIIALTGMTRPTRVDGAGYAPWASTQVVSEIFWGWEPTDG